MKELTIIGAGLAGCEAAFQAAKRGIHVKLYEMRPFKMTPAHKTDKLAELVCSSSFKSQNPETAHGLLKSEMDKLDSLILDCAKKSSVPGGDALCVDRKKFSDLVTASIKENPLIELINQEVTDVPLDKPCIIAAGPLVSEDLIKEIIKDDDHIDKLYLKIKSELLEEAKTDCELIERAIDYIMIARYLERLGDHLTNVCERIYYMETGVMKELH